MASRELSLGHSMVGGFEKADFIMPKNLDNDSWVITTLWNSEKKEGQTMKIFVPLRSYWELRNNPPILIGKHKSKSVALKFHDKTVKKLREDDRYC